MSLYRSSPSFVSPYLKNYDNLLRRMLSDIINVRLESGPAWSQASLPVRAGGIGIRSTVQLAPSAYLTSAAGCAELVLSSLPPWLQDTSNPWLVSAKVICSQGHNQAPPPPPLLTAIFSGLGMHPGLKAYTKACWSRPQTPQ